MHCTSLLPECYSTRDLNVGANGGPCSLYNNERTLKSGHSYNALLTLPTTDQLYVCDKEVLRQTMLEHESVFRAQVRELHHLYRRQGELMDEIKRRELSEKNLQLKTSLSYSFSPKNSSESAHKTSPISILASVNPAVRRLGYSSAENFESTSRFSGWKSMQAGLDTAQTEDSIKECQLLHSKCEKPKKKQLDLELPADVYIDSEEEDQFREEDVSKVPEVPCYPPKRMPEVSQKSDLEQFQCGGLNSNCQGGPSSPHPFPRRTYDLVDLNEPISLEDAMASHSFNFLGSGNDVHNFSKEIVSSIQTGRADEACRIGIHPEDRQQELPPRNDGAGQCLSNLNSIPQVSSSGKLPMPFIQLKDDLPAEFSPLYPWNERDWKLKNQGISTAKETSVRNHALCNDDYRGLASSCSPMAYQLGPQSATENSESSSVSFWRKPTCNVRRNPIAVQALPSFNIAVPSVASASADVGRLNPLRNSSCFGSQSQTRTEACSPMMLNCITANGSLYEVHKNCFQCSSGRDVNSAKIMDLNMPPSCLLEVSQQNVGAEDGGKKDEDSLAVFPGLGEKPHYVNISGERIQDLSQMDTVFSQDFVTSVFDAEQKRFQPSASPGNEKILESSNLKKPHVSAGQFFALASSSNYHSAASEDKDVTSNQKSGVVDINLASCPVLSSGKQCTTDDVSVDITVESKPSMAEKQFDLNSCMSEDESSPTLSVPRVIRKTVAEIDLEAPVSPENKEGSPPRGESEESQLETPIMLSKQEDKDQKDELARMAADVIVLISTPGLQKMSLQNSIQETLETSSIDSQLHWFAGVVSSLAIDLDSGVGVVLGGKDGDDQKELSCDGSDYFEAMTLELVEMKVEEYCCKSGGQKEDGTSAVLLPSQPRRGRTRKGRLRKDFQTEVLPSLASLSRHEVTEDLQTIGGLMEAAGFPVETSLRKRNASRNACSRGRRQSGNSFRHGIENTVCLPVKQRSNDSVFAIEETCLKGWGNMNKRRRGPRIPSSNPRLICS